jgi:hypothetical protein
MHLLLCELWDDDQFDGEGCTRLKRGSIKHVRNKVYVEPSEKPKRRSCCISDHSPIDLNKQTVRGNSAKVADISMVSLSVAK